LKPVGKMGAQQRKRREGGLLTGQGLIMDEGLGGWLRGNPNRGLKRGGWYGSERHRIGVSVGGLIWAYLRGKARARYQGDQEKRRHSKGFVVGRPRVGRRNTGYWSYYREVLRLNFSKSRQSTRGKRKR